MKIQDIYVTAKSDFIDTSNEYYTNNMRVSRIIIIAESLSQHDEKHVVPTPISGIRVGGRRIWELA
jgi:hypothetical protein